MAHLLDTNVAIHLRDKDTDITAAVAGLDAPVMLSIITRVELEGGVYRDPANTTSRRARLDAILEFLPVLPFDDAAANAYRGIIAAIGYSIPGCWIA